jgi:hypothetical protein
MRAQTSLSTACRGLSTTRDTAAAGAGKTALLPESAAALQENL